MHAYVWWKKLHYFLVNLSSFFVIIFKVEIFWLAITEIIKRKPLRKWKIKQNTTQVSEDLLLKLLKVELLLLLWVNEWVQQLVRQQWRSSWRTLKEEQLLKGTIVRNSSGLIFLASIASAQWSSYQHNLCNKENTNAVNTQGYSCVKCWDKCRCKF